MKLTVQGVPEGISIVGDDLTFDFKSPAAVAWLEMLIHYKAQLAGAKYAQAPEPVVPHAPGPEINDLLRDIFFKK